MKVFLSFHFDAEHPEHQQFVSRVRYYLSQQKDVSPYCYAGDVSDENWRVPVGRAVRKCDKFVLFVGRTLGNVQEHEVTVFRGEHEHAIAADALAVLLPGHGPVPDDDFQFRTVKVPGPLSDLCGEDFDRQKELEFESRAEDCGQAILCHFRRSSSPLDAWIPADGLPLGYPFDYEKVIIGEFAAGQGRLASPSRLAQGCPIRWPEVERVRCPVCQTMGSGHGDNEKCECRTENPIDPDERGEDRDDHRIVVDVRGKYHDRTKEPEQCLAALKLTFPEAGPHDWLAYPRRQTTLKVGIVVSGGIAPGINAVISGVVCRHYRYQREQEKRRQQSPQDFPRYNLEIVLYRDGFYGVRKGLRTRLTEADVRERSTLGGSMIGTSRFDEILEISDRRERSGFLQGLVQELRNTDILYVIGGEGSMRGAHAIWTRAQKEWMKAEQDTRRPRPLSVIGIPKTMDNDVLWVWQSFGFLSAVEKAKEFIVQLNTEAKSNPRLGIAQLFGSDSGFVVSHAALASGECMVALIPEVNFTMEALSEYVRGKLRDQFEQAWSASSSADGARESPHGLVVLGETVIPLDVEEYIDNPDYPELVLEEKEKEDLRSFMGSSLLRPSDLKDWRGLAAKLGKAAEGTQPGPERRVWEMLSPELQVFLGRLPDNYDEDERLKSDKRLLEERLKSLVLDGVNRVLQSGEFAEPQDPWHFPVTPELQELADILKSLRAMSNARTIPGEQVKALVQSMSNVAVSCEALEITRLLDKMSSPRPGTAEGLTDIPRQDCLRFVNRLIKRLTEKYNRLLFDALFPEYVEKSVATQCERRVRGQTPDSLRTAGVKIIARVLQRDIRTPDKMPDPDNYWRNYRVFVSEPRYLIRAIQPSVSDVISGQRLGVLAVDNAMAGCTDFMVSQWLTEYVLVPLRLAVLGRKRVPRNGIFWKSVLAATRQPATML